MICYRLQLNLDIISSTSNLCVSDASVCIYYGRPVAKYTFYNSNNLRGACYLHFTIPSSVADSGGAPRPLKSPPPPVQALLAILLIC